MPMNRPDAFVLVAGNPFTNCCTPSTVVVKNGTTMTARITHSALVINGFVLLFFARFEAKNKGMRSDMMSIVAKLIVLNAGANAVRKLNGANWASPVVGLVSNTLNSNANEPMMMKGMKRYECVLDAAEIFVPSTFSATVSIPELSLNHETPLKFLLQLFQTVLSMINLSYSNRLSPFVAMTSWYQ